MRGNKSFSMKSHQVLAMLLVVVCLTDTLVAQTFQYSCGWTNGRKRSSTPSMLNDYKVTKMPSMYEMPNMKYIPERRQNFERNLWSSGDSRRNWGCRRDQQERRKL